MADAIARIAATGMKVCRFVGRKIAIIEPRGRNIRQQDKHNSIGRPRAVYFV
jgi:hypothetical protein